MITTTKTPLGRAGLHNDGRMRGAKAARHQTDSPPRCERAPVAVSLLAEKSPSAPAACRSGVTFDLAAISKVSDAAQPALTRVDEYHVRVAPYQIGDDHAGMIEPDNCAAASASRTA